MNRRFVSASYFRSFIFGVEDSLVSTVGLLSGIAVVNVPRETIILTGVVLIFVEAISMAVGTFISESSAEDYIERKEAPYLISIKAGVIMFFSYFVSGFVPLAPYLIIASSLALPISIITSLVALLFLGILSGKISRISIFHASTKMVLLGGTAILVGILVGKFVQ